MTEKTLYNRIRDIGRIKIFLSSEASLPYWILFIAVITVFTSYYLSAEKAVFIYDPYTIETSGMGLKEIRKKGLRERVDFTFIEASDADFSLQDDGRKRIVLTSYLYSIIINESSYPSFFNDRQVYLFGPLFDYNTNNTSSVNVSLEFSNKEGIDDIWEGIETVFFLIPPDIFGKEDTVEPENQLISLLKISFLASEPEGKTYSLLLNEENRAKSTLPEGSEKDASILSVLCIRSFNNDSRNMIESYSGNMVFFDFINTKNLFSSINPAKKRAAPQMLSYDYELSLQRIILSENGEISTGMVNYQPVYALRDIGQKK
ncbi:MAG: hypothetical protein RBT69_06290 [Spirochaetia bacterium]|jgi:hypothetical protein|nr:hypothetical protein [Spirochaetia bacterium]